MAHGIWDCLPLPVDLCLAQSAFQEEAAAVLWRRLGSLCPLGKEDGAWPVLLSLCTSYSEQETVTVSKEMKFPCNYLQGISPGDGPEAFEDAIVAGVPEARGSVLTDFHPRDTLVCRRIQNDLLKCNQLMPSGKRAELLLPGTQVHQLDTHHGPGLTSSSDARDSRSKEGKWPPCAAEIFLSLAGTASSSLPFRVVVSPFLSCHGRAHLPRKKQWYQLSIPFPLRCRLLNTGCCARGLPAPPSTSTLHTQGWGETM